MAARTAKPTAGTNGSNHGRGDRISDIRTGTSPGGRPEASEGFGAGGTRVSGIISVSISALCRDAVRNQPACARSDHSRSFRGFHQAGNGVCRHVENRKRPINELIRSGSDATGAMGPRASGQSCHQARTRPPRAAYDRPADLASEAWRPRAGFDHVSKRELSARNSVACRPPSHRSGSTSGKHRSVTG